MKKQGAVVSIVAALLVASGAFSAASAALMPNRHQESECGCTDDPPFVRNAVSARPKPGDQRELLELLAKSSLASPSPTNHSCRDAAITVRKLAMLADASAVTPLIRTLKHPACRIRAASAEALGSFRDPGIVPPLMLALRDSDRRVRSGAAWSLSKVGDARAVNQLIIAIADSNAQVRQAAAAALGHIGDSRAAPALTKALGDTEKHVREAAAEALGKLKRQ